MICKWEIENILPKQQVSQVGECWVMLITFISFEFPTGERGAECIIALLFVPTCLTWLLYTGFTPYKWLNFQSPVHPHSSQLLQRMDVQNHEKPGYVLLINVFCPNCQTFWIRAYRQTPFGRVFRNSWKPEVPWDICAVPSSCVNHQTRSRWNVSKSNWG